MGGKIPTLSHLFGVTLFMKRETPSCSSKWWAFLCLIAILAYCLSLWNHALYVERDLKDTYQRAEFDKQILKLRARWFYLEIENEVLRNELEYQKNKKPTQKKL